MNEGHLVTVDSLERRLQAQQSQINTLIEAHNVLCKNLAALGDGVEATLKTQSSTLQALCGSVAMLSKRPDPAFMRNELFNFGGEKQ